jgi:hypothetical protein
MVILLVVMSVVILSVVTLTMVILLVVMSVVILSVVNHCLRLVVMVAEDYHGLLMVQKQLRQERARTK